MSYGLNCLDAAGHYYIDPLHVLHIKASMPETLRETFVGRMMADREKTRKRHREDILELRSDDMEFDEIVYD